METLGIGHHSFRVAHVLHLIEVIKRWHVRADELLAGTGLVHDALSDPRGRVAVPTMMALVERARQLTGELAIGLYIGLHTRATLYGQLGFAVVSAATIREAIEMSIRFGPIVTTAVTTRLRVERRVASFMVDEHADFGSARDIVLLTTLVALWQVSRSLTARDLPTCVAEFAMPEPSYGDRLGASPVPMRFGQPVNRLTFDARSLDLPYTMPDPVAMRLAREQCQHEIDALGRNVELTSRVRGLITRPEGGIRTLDEVAAVMNRSARTLKRQLGAQGVSFSTLRDGERRERAVVFLRSPELSLGEIAERLGYSKVTSFERAFQRWTKSTPAAYRRAPAPAAALRSA